MHTPARLLSVLAACALTVGSTVSPAFATRPDAIRPTGFTTNMFNDVAEPATQIGDGKCDTEKTTTGNQCTLRAAVQEADYWGPGANINIKIVTGTYTLSIPPSGTNDQASGDLDVKADVTFNGPAGGTGAIIKGATGFGDRLIDVDSSVVSNVNFFNCTLQGGAAPDGGNGGAIDWMGSGLLTLSNVVVQSNNATGSGGGIYFGAGTLALPNKVVFSANSATLDGGGLDVEGRAVVTYANISVTNNTAGRNGGGVAAFPGAGGSGTVSMDTGTISGNYATGSGGGVYGGSGTLSIPLNVTFDGNRAGANGGAIDVEGSVQATLAHLVIENGSATNGGGISAFADTSGTGWLNFTFSDVTGNSASGSGGGIDMARSTVYEVNILENSATNGGGVSMRGSNPANLLSSRNLVGGNTATQNGGGIYASSCSPTCGTVEAVSIGFHQGNGAPAPDSTGNSAGAAGSGVYVNGSLTLVRSGVLKNTITGSGAGGSVYHTGSGALILTSVTVAGNIGGTTPGGVVFDSSSVDTVTNLTIAGNTGAIANGVNVTGTATPKFKNTILADDAAGGVPVCKGTITSQGHNINSDDSCLLRATGDMKSTDPGLSPKGISDWGGGTNMWPPANPNSIPNDNGDDNGCPTVDQRFVSRPLDGDSRNGIRCDIGSFEWSVSTANGDILTTGTAPLSVLKGAQLIYTLTLTNKGPLSSKNTVVTLTLPSALSFVSCVAGGGISGRSCTSTGQVVTLRFSGGIDTTTPGTATLITLVASGTTVTSVTNTFTATSDTPDQFAYNNTWTAVTQVI